MLLGIRLGTCTSTLAIVSSDDNETSPEVISDESGDRFIPTCISFSGDDVLTGTFAKQRAPRHPRQTLFAFHSLVGVHVSDSLAQLHRKRFHAQLETTETSVHYSMEETNRSPEDITLRFLSSLIATAEGHTGKKVEGFLLCVPDDYTEAQRHSLAQLCRSNRLPLLQIVGDATAVLCGYAVLPIAPTSNGEDQPDVLESLNKDGNYLVIDVGGHALSVQALAMRSGVLVDVASVLDSTVSGYAFDDILCAHFAKEFQRKHKIELTDSRQAMTKLRHGCEVTRTMLSQADTAPLYVDSLYDGIDYSNQMHRGRFDMLAGTLLQQFKTTVRQALDQASWSVGDVSEVLLVGGCSKMPSIVQATQSVFPGFTTKRHNQMHPVEAAAIGAALQAGLIYSQQNNGSRHGELVDHEVACTSSTIYLRIPEEEYDEALMPEARLSKEGKHRLLPLVQKHHPLPLDRRFDITLRQNQTGIHVALVTEDEAALAEVQLAQLDSNAVDLQLQLKMDVNGELQVIVLDLKSRQAMSVGQ